MLNIITVIINLLKYYLTSKQSVIHQRLLLHCPFCTVRISLITLLFTSICNSVLNVGVTAVNRIDAVLLSSGQSGWGHTQLSELKWKKQMFQDSRVWIKVL